MASEREENSFGAAARAVLWVLLGCAAVFVYLFVHYEHPNASVRFEQAQRRRNVERMERQDQEFKAQEAGRKAKMAAYLDEVASLNTQVEARWRSDIQAAQLTASPGVVPPMLKVQEASNAVTVTNQLDDQPVCVSLQRVARRSARANDYDRCRLDTPTCRELLPHASYRFALYRTGNAAACMTAPLEFRVGTPLDPEPSWWSSSALEDFDARPPAEPLRTQSRDLWPLGGNVDQLKQLLAEPDRAQRWRREFGPKIDTRGVEKN